MVVSALTCFKREADALFEHHGVIVDAHTCKAPFGIGGMFIRLVIVIFERRV